MKNMITLKIINQLELSKIEDKVKNKVKECEKFAEESDYPDLSLMYDAVYEQNDYPFLTHKL